MTKPKSKIKIIFLSLIWIGGVCGAAILMMARRDEQGIHAYLAVGLAVAMLLSFAVAYLPRKLQGKNFAELSEKLSTGLVLLFVILILAAFLIKGYKNIGIFGSGVVLLFLFTFIRLFISFIKDSSKSPRGRPQEGKNGAESDEG